VRIKIPSSLEESEKLNFILSWRLEIAATQTGRAATSPRKVRLRGLATLGFSLVHAGGLRLCRSELYSPKTFHASSNRQHN
jgi:hypothetical protein